VSDYDRIGHGYAGMRQADPRVARLIHAALGAARTIVNVGAGTGNYEPADRDVVAVEPSTVMITQRTSTAAPVVQAVAEALPFADGRFDAALAILTVHHWHDRARGLAELQRVARRQVVFSYEAGWVDSAWIMDYWPQIRDVATEVDPPDVACLARHLDVADVVVVPVPRDCTDGFGAAYWGRPEAYLGADVQAGMSCFTQLTAEARAAGNERLRADLESGAWDARHGHLRREPELDVGYRIVIAGR
jgi:SAM-dependent methyltransferase